MNFLLFFLHDRHLAQSLARLSDNDSASDSESELDCASSKFACILCA